jgi:hypothetical protein
MRDARIFTSGSFRLDAGDERLWRGNGAVPLTTKPMAALRYLIDHTGRLVPGDELVVAVWETSYVSEAAVTSCILDIHPQAPSWTNCTSDWAPQPRATASSCSSAAKRGSLRRCWWTPG